MWMMAFVPSRKKIRLLTILVRRIKRYFQKQRGIKQKTSTIFQEICLCSVVPDDLSSYIFSVFCFSLQSRH